MGRLPSRPGCRRARAPRPRAARALHESRANARRPAERRGQFAARGECQDATTLGWRTRQGLLPTASETPHVSAGRSPQRSPGGGATLLHALASWSPCSTLDADARSTAPEYGRNVAVVFAVKKGASLPKRFGAWRVIDGDDTDLRFLDPSLCIVGLRANGRARKDTESPFLVRAPFIAVREVDHVRSSLRAVRAHPDVARDRMGLRTHHAACAAR
jgi:hypothetical protein